MPTDTNRARRFYERGVYYYARGKWSDAANNLRDALELYPEHAAARLHLGAALARQRRYLDALNILEEGRHLPNVTRGDMYRLLRLLAVVCMIRQDYPAAEYYLELALQGGPRTAERNALANQLAAVMCKAGKFEASFDLFLECARSRPTEPDTLEPRHDDATRGE